MENIKRRSHKSCVKIYLCSDPEDSEQERKALRDSVFPMVRDHCRRVHGLEFRVIDPYEGPASQRVQCPKTRQQLLEECRESSPGPFFVALVGQQYGRACLPAQVEVSEFHTVLWACQQMGLSTQALEHWYHRDENAIPASFILHGQTGEKHEEAHDISVILQKAVTCCIQEGSITFERAHKYFASALEIDLRFALENRPQEDIKRCLCYVHKVAGMRTQGRGDEDDPSGLILAVQERGAESHPMAHLQEQLLPNLIPTSQLLMYTPMPSGHTAEARKLYISGLCQQLHNDLLKLIDRTVAREETCLGGALFQDFLQHLDLCHIYSHLYKMESSTVQSIKTYLQQSDTKYPFILSGGPCTGKTVLLAHCATQVGTWLHGINPVVIARFIGSDKSSLKHLLTSVCHQIATSIGSETRGHWFQSFSQMSQAFRDLLSKVCTHKHLLVLVFDGLDQVGQGENEPCSLSWLPSFLPPNIKLLISTTPKKAGTLQTLKAMYPESSLFLELGPKHRRELSQMFTDHLLSSNRRITSGQQLYVHRALEGCPLMLHVELLHRQACWWGSESEVTEDDLTGGVHTNISRFLKQLEKKHGKELVSRAMCYVTGARFGIMEAELTDILSADDSVLSQFLPGEETLPYKLRVPEAVVEYLLLDLQGFLVKRQVGGSEVLFWVSRHFPLVIHKLYLNSDRKTQEIYSALADYFSGRWAYGRTKSLIVGMETVRQSQSQPASRTSPVKIYIDRQHPGQPWCFQSPSLPLVQVNLRKVLEFPFHLKESVKLEDLGESVMKSFQFHEAMLEAGLLDELISQLEDAALLVFHQELGVLAMVLRDSVCLLQQSPKDLPMVMQAKLLPFLNVFPGLETYAKHVVEEGLKNNGVTMVHSPGAVVPSKCWALSELDASPVEQVLHLQSNSIVVILQNGSIWAWNENIPGGSQLIRLSGLKCLSARSAQGFLLLSSECKRLLFCDLHTTSRICEVDVWSSIPDPCADTSAETAVEGFFVIKNTLFVWYKDASFVSMYDVNTGTGVPPLQCQFRVSCVSCSTDGQLAICGQDNGVVSLFDIQSKSHLSTFSNPTKVPIIVIIHFQHGAELMCMNKYGGVYLWDTENVLEAKLKKACSSTENQEEVLYTDCAQQSEAFIICKRHQVLLWDMEEWAVKEQFTVPAGKTFTQALLISACRLLVASLVDCPFLLVWKMTTGQCVLSLDIGHTRTVDLFKTESALFAVTPNGTLTVWHLDLILGASAISRTGTRVKKIILASSTGRFYTADGTELVWQWDLGSGRTEACFQHEGRVDAIAISAGCHYLITATSVEIYVWQTDTGQNLHRICSNAPVSQILVTPNGNFALSLCMGGLSHVWKLRSGHIVCNIHPYLRNAVVSPEGTFVLGIHKQDLLAVSLWSGCISKRFSCSSQLDVLAFQALLHSPDYLLVVTTSGGLFTWNLIEETIYRHLQLPCSFLNQPDLFQFSSDGRYGIISTDGKAINILDTQNERLCVLETEGPVLLVSLDGACRCVIFICEPVTSDCSCRLHSMPVLKATSVKNGRNLGRFLLGSAPTTLCLSEDLCAYVGFEDGSVGVYAICDVMERRGPIRSFPRQLSQDPQCLCEETQIRWPIKKHTITWVDSNSEVVSC